MLRAIFGVIFGFILMVVVVFGGNAIAWNILGADGAYKAAGSYDPNTTWIVISLVVAFIAAVVGGLVCMLIAARRSNAGATLAIIVLVLGLLLAFVFPHTPPADRPEVRPDDLAMLDAMQWSEQPKSVTYLNPIVGCLGVLIGASLRGGKKDTAAGH